MVADLDGVVEIRSSRIFFREMEVPSASSTPVPVSAVGKFLQFRRRRLVSPGYEGLFCLTPPAFDS